MNDSFFLRSNRNRLLDDYFLICFNMLYLRKKNNKNNFLQIFLTLTSIIPLLPTRTKRAERKEERFFRDGVDFPDALVVRDDGKFGLADAEGDWAA